MNTELLHGLAVRLPQRAHCLSHVPRSCICILRWQHDEYDLTLLTELNDHRG